MSDVLNLPPMVLRCDASNEIGTGHLMRSKALGDVWSQIGGRTIIAGVTELDRYTEQLDTDLYYVKTVTAETGSIADAEETAAIAAEADAAWIVADNYQLGGEWMNHIFATNRLLVLDDDGCRKGYQADYILNSSPAASPAPYDRRSSGTQLLLGPKFLPLRKEFARWRTWQRRHPARARRLLVSLGGTDPRGVAVQILPMLLSLREVETHLVVGRACQDGDRLEQSCIGTNVKVHRSVGNMASLMAECDFALTAASSTALECVFMQLPIFAIITAQNQVNLAQGLESTAVGTVLGTVPVLDLDRIKDAVIAMAESEEQRTTRAERGRSLIDGYGADRVVAHLRSRVLDLRACEPDDARMIWEWANDPDVRQASFSSDPIPWNTHLDWFRSQMTDPAIRMWLILDGSGDTPVAVIRFRIDGKEATTSVTVAPNARGRGIGTSAIIAGSGELFRSTGCELIHAHVKTENRASQSAFLKAGYRRLDMNQFAGCIAEHLAMERSQYPFCEFN